MDYDVVVIGAGNGGLTASATLARKGLRVLLLERHNIPGGCATSFCRGRFEFEVALHQLSGLGTPEKPGPLRMTLDKLDVMDDLEFVEIQYLYSVHMPDGFSATKKIIRRGEGVDLMTSWTRRSTSTAFCSEARIFRKASPPCLKNGIPNGSASKFAGG
jgi:prolycopene isomerase